MFCIWSQITLFRNSCAPTANGNSPIYFRVILTCTGLYTSDHQKQVVFKMIKFRLRIWESILATAESLQERLRLNQADTLRTISEGLEPMHFPRPDAPQILVPSTQSRDSGIRCLGPATRCSVSTVVVYSKRPLPPTTDPVLKFLRKIQLEFFCVEKTSIR